VAVAKAAVEPGVAVAKAVVDLGSELAKAVEPGVVVAKAVVDLGAEVAKAAVAQAARRWGEALGHGARRMAAPRVACPRS
jgi:hypothetical protein